MAKGRHRPLKRPRANPAKPKVPQPIPYPKSPLAPWGQGLINQEADKRVGAVLNPQEAAARRSTASSVAAIQGTADAARGMLAGIPGRTQQIYKDATAELGGLGAGLSGHLKEEQAAEAAKAAEFAASQGAPAPAAAPDYENAVVYGGAVIPGGNLASQGAAQASEATRLPAVFALRDQEDVRQAASKGAQALADLEAQRPELHDKIMDTLYSLEMEKLKGRQTQQGLNIQTRAQALYEKNFGERVRHNVQGERTARARVDVSTKSYNLRVKEHSDAMDKAAAEGRQPNASLSKVYGYVVDDNGVPIKNNKGKNIPVVQSGSKGKGVGSKSYGSAVGKADELLRRNTPGTDRFGEPIPAKNPITFAQAQTLLMNRYQLSRSVARKALVAAGWHAPAGPGRGGGPGNKTGNYGGPGGR
jgi:hypothetical protein